MGGPLQTGQVSSKSVRWLVPPLPGRIVDALLREPLLLWLTLFYPIYGQRLKFFNFYGYRLNFWAFYAYRLTPLRPSIKVKSKRGGKRDEFATKQSIFPEYIILYRKHLSFNLLELVRRRTQKFVHNRLGVKKIIQIKPITAGF